MTQGELQRKLAEAEARRLTQLAADKRKAVADWEREKDFALEDLKVKTLKEQEQLRLL